MSQKNYQDLTAELYLERKENKPEANSLKKGTVIAVNSGGVFLDLEKTYEAHISTKELGQRSPQEFELGEQLELFVIEEDKQQPGIFKASIKAIEDEKKWQELESLQGKNLEVTISKIVKSGVEVLIEATNQIGFIPMGYLDTRHETLQNKDKETWLGKKIPARIHELEKSKNKIILNHRQVNDEIREAQAKETLNSISIGQTITGKIVRISNFGVFIDIGGLDALVPASELSWRRFKNPGDIVNVGDEITARIFKIETDTKKIALSVKQLEPDPWSNLPESLQPGYQAEAKVVSKADFGVFVEISPGIEALLHKSNFGDKQPEMDEVLNVEVVNVEASKKRMGVKLTMANNVEEVVETKENSTKELENVN